MNSESGQVPCGSSVDPDVQVLIDRAVTEGGVPGVVVVVEDARNGSTSRCGVAGVADRDTGAPRRPEHQFRIGSISKTFVATVALQLAAEGVLALDDPIATVLPGVVEGNGYHGASITLRQLLGHTSGVFNYVEDYGSLDLDATYAPEQLVRLALTHPPVFQPGANWGYSNTNYILVGMIIERVTGSDLAEVIAQRISHPLNLTETYLPTTGDTSIHGLHPRHYTTFMTADADAPIHDVTSLEMSMFWAAGGMISTPGDLNTFIAALLTGQLLPDAELHQMLTTRETTNWIPRTWYGLGLAFLALPGHITVWGMIGTMFGSQTATFATRDGSHCLTANINGDWAQGPWHDPSDIFTDLLTIEFGTA